MVFTTEVHIPEFPWRIDYSTGVVFMGSCFSENMGQKLLDLKFPVELNPFGVLYNPQSIANSLRFLMENKRFTADDLFFDQGIWNSFHHHSSFSDVELSVAIDRINHRMDRAHLFLRNARFLMVTWGTAWVYRHKTTGQIVSNCHKVPASTFERGRLGVDEIVTLYQSLLTQLHAFNPGLKVVFTVSPIRHWKDGAVENQVSKSTLILAINQLQQSTHGKNCAYFPAYELVMDELRDYRYYAADMIHISDVAVEYIFERFSSALISGESMQVSKRIEKIRKSMNHRPFKRNTQEYLQFVDRNIQEIRRLSSSFPTIDFSGELDFFENKIQ